MAIRYSIIIATYNRAHQLPLTLAAFEAQTYPKHLLKLSSLMMVQRTERKNWLKLIVLHIR